MLTIGPGVVEWVAKQTHEYGNFGAAQGIGWLRNGEIVGGIVYSDYNGASVSAHAASDGSRRWLNRQFLWTMFDYPFNQLRVKRVTTCVGQGNTDSQRFLLHLGFTLETTLEQAHPTGGLHVFRMFRSDCKWIRADFFKPLAKAA